MDREDLRPKLEELFARMASDLAMHLPVPAVLKHCQETLEEARKHLLAAIDSGKLSAASLPEVQLELQRFLLRNANVPELAPLQLEWIAFAQQLTTRQGTHVPNWNEFYEQRADLERRIHERGPESPQ